MLSLAQARRLFAVKAISAIELEHLVDGLETAYRKARKAFRKAYDKPSDESFHAWRKAAQLHWRHMLLLSHGWPEALLARAGEAKEVSRLLGEDHDYSVLVAFAQMHDGSALAPGDLKSLSELCRARQEELRAWAKPRGDRLFAEGAECLRERIAHYWSSARCLSGMTVAPEQKARSPIPATKVKRVRRPRRKRQGLRGRS